MPVTYTNIVNIENDLQNLISKPHSFNTGKK